MLSALADSFLSTLERRPYIPTKEVEIIIRDGGFPCFTSWLDFHERYAGYMTDSGREQIVWGLAHKEPEWLPPNGVEIDREDSVDIWYIYCADAHFGHTLQLDNRGEFLGLGFDAESFDIHIERKALLWSFDNKGKTRVFHYKEELDELSKESMNKLKDHLVKEASDRHRQYYMDDNYLLVTDTKTGKLVRGRQHVR